MDTARDEGGSDGGPHARNLGPAAVREEDPEAEAENAIQSLESEDSRERKVKKGTKGKKAREKEACSLKPQ